MKILIADDESDARERLRRLIAELDAGHEVAGEVANGRAALAFCQTHPVDLALLDIEMPGSDGLEVAATLSRLSPPPAVILVTAYPEHALEAFARGVQDYLVKPVRRERLDAALERARRPTRLQQAALATLPPPPRQLVVPCRGGLAALRLEDVLYLRAEQKYVTACHIGGQLLLDDSLKSLEQAFPEFFLRIHRNALVARRRIEGLIREPDGTFRVRLRGCAESLPVSRRHLAGIRHWLKWEKS